MTDKFRELERWEQLQQRAITRGMVTSVDRHKIKMTPGILKVLESSRRQEIHFLSLEEAESWLDGYDWMLEHATNLGWDLKAAEKDAYTQWDQQRILRVLSTE